MTQIKNDPKYLQNTNFKDSKILFAQLGGLRAQGAMWKQALEVWRWPTSYRATWAVRSVNVKCDYVVERKVNPEL